MRILYALKYWNSLMINSLGEYLFRKRPTTYLAAILTIVNVQFQASSFIWVSSTVLGISLFKNFIFMEFFMCFVLVYFCIYVGKHILCFTRILLQILETIFSDTISTLPLFRLNNILPSFTNNAHLTFSTLAVHKLICFSSKIKLVVLL